ncbi:meiotic recombination protein REC8 homolog isoform X1 [Mizuhopecten yessoensis]|uniref:meiotic recombination protein REC8 homolog isoform X1 n=1 Tax=Mizuhopecten yessoensis TaxID=6573 RepID=UPI000B45B28F|nr:meiotic recombination protein REC8 homolog isoform X1 [Mizuhopecten yessoensis]
MFYHQGILQKRGGKFGIIWLAATRIEHLKRRELCEVNLQKTCDDIIDHILVRVQAKTPGKKRTRFSLYLSSQLLYGATRVLAKQSDFLFSDASTFFTRVRMAIAADAEAEIDLKGIFRCETVTIPDMATIDSPGRPGFDPTFGLMRMGSSEAKITYPELEMWRVNSSMVIPGSPYLSPIPKRRGSSPASKDSSHVIQPELGSPHTVSSKDEITIREEEIQIPDIEVPGEKDLPTFDGKELDMILEEPLDPNINWMNILSPVVPEPPKETTLDQMAQEQGTLSPKEQTPFSRPDGELPQRRDMALSPGVTPIPKMTPVQAQRMRPSLTMQLTPVAPSPVRRRRRRHLCIDRNTQISKEQLRNNMKTGADTCLPLVLPDPQNSTVKDLFSRPGKKALNHPSILPLWESNTKYGISETDSDRGIPVWSVPDLHLQEEAEPRSRKRLRISTPPIEKLASPPQKVRQDVTMETSLLPEVAQDMPSIEIPRDTSISMERSRHGDVTPVSLHHSRSLLSDVDKSKDSFTDEPSAKRSRSSRKTRSRGGTSSEDDLADITARAPSDVSFPTREDVSVAGNLSIVQEEEMHVSRLQDIPAMVAEPQLSHHRDILIRTIDRLDREDTPTTFQHICPPLSSSRKMAAKMFSTLLELCAGNKLEVEQYHSYDDIYITKGQNW